MFLPAVQFNQTTKNFIFFFRIPDGIQPEYRSRFVGGVNNQVAQPKQTVYQRPFHTVILDPIVFYELVFSPEDSRLISELFIVNFVSDAVHHKDLIS